MAIFKLLFVWAVLSTYLQVLTASPPEQSSRKNSTDPAPDLSTFSGLPPGDSLRKKSLSSPNATISTDQILEFSSELPRVKSLIQSALDLTTQGLTYTYGSDDPEKGGMDCSGFTSYILRVNGFNDVPRDASGQYRWLRKIGAFRAVLSDNPTTFELDELRPGDILFWMATSRTDHDPAITHSMIYLGTEKDTHGRIMVGSSDGRSYQGKSRWGVSVFDFQIKAESQVNESRSTHPRFVGYATPPGLRD